MNKIKQNPAIILWTIAIIGASLANTFLFNKTFFSWSFGNVDTWIIMLVFATFVATTNSQFFSGAGRWKQKKDKPYFLLWLPILIIYIAYDGATSNEVSENLRYQNNQSAILEHVVSVDSTEYVQALEEKQYWINETARTGKYFVTRIEAADKRVVRAKNSIDKELSRQRKAIASDPNAGNNILVMYLGYLIATIPTWFGVGQFIWQVRVGYHENQTDKKDRMIQEMVDAKIKGHDLPYRFDQIEKAGIPRATASRMINKGILECSGIDVERSGMKLERNGTGLK